MMSLYYATLNSRVLHFRISTSIGDKSPFHSLTPVGPILNECKRLVTSTEKHSLVMRAALCPCLRRPSNPLRGDHVSNDINRATSGLQLDDSSFQHQREDATCLHLNWVSRGDINPGFRNQHFWTRCRRNFQTSHNRHGLVGEVHRSPTPDR